MNKFIITLKQTWPFIVGMIVFVLLSYCLTGCTAADQADNTANSAINGAVQLCKSGTTKVKVEAASGVETTTITCQVNE